MRPLPPQPTDEHLAELFGSLRAQVAVVVTDLVERVRDGIDEAQATGRGRGPDPGDVFTSMLAQAGNLLRALLGWRSDDSD